MDQPIDLSFGTRSRIQPCTSTVADQSTTGPSDESIVPANQSPMRTPPLSSYYWSVSPKPSTSFGKFHETPTNSPRNSIFNKSITNASSPRSSETSCSEFQTTEEISKNQVFENDLNSSNKTVDTSLAEHITKVDKPTPEFKTPNVSSLLGNFSTTPVAPLKRTYDEMLLEKFNEETPAFTVPDKAKLFNSSDEMARKRMKFYERLSSMNDSQSRTTTPTKSIKFLQSESTVPTEISTHSVHQPKVSDHPFNLESQENLNLANKLSLLAQQLQQTQQRKETSDSTGKNLSANSSIEWLLLEEYSKQLQFLAFCGEYGRYNNPGNFNWLNTVNPILLYKGIQDNSMNHIAASIFHTLNAKIAVEEAGQRASAVEDHFQQLNSTDHRILPPSESPYPILFPRTPTSSDDNMQSIYNHILNAQSVETVLKSESPAIKLSDHKKFGLCQSPSKRFQRASSLDENLIMSNVHFKEGFKNYVNKDINDSRKAFTPPELGAQYSLNWSLPDLTSSASRTKIKCSDKDGHSGVESDSLNYFEDNICLTAPTNSVSKPDTYYEKRFSKFSSASLKNEEIIIPCSSKAEHPHSSCSVVTPLVGPTPSSIYLQGNDVNVSLNTVNRLGFRKKPTRALTGRHVRSGRGASISTLATLRVKLMQRTQQNYIPTSTSSSRCSNRGRSRKRQITSEN